MSHSASCGCGHNNVRASRVTSDVTSRVTSGVTAPCRTMTMTAVEEKQELRELTDQLASLMTRMRRTRQEPGTDAASYQETIGTLELELDKVKNLYDSELTRLRQRLDDSTSCRASTSAMYESSQVELNDLRGRLSGQDGLLDQLHGELSSTKADLGKARHRLADMALQLEEARGELGRRPDNTRLQQDHEDLKRRIEMEMKQRVEGEAMIKSLREKLHFEAQLQNQMKTEMGDRLRGANDTIRTLELKLKDATSNAVDYTQVLAKLRDGTASELQRYKAETGEALERNLSSLRIQIESEKSVRGGLTLEKEHMEKLIADLRQDLADSEGQMAGLMKQRDALEETLRSERSRSYNQIQELEVKLGQMNDVMLERVKECSEARDTQVSLKTEIDTFKVLLDEENRLCSTTPVPPTTSRCQDFHRRSALDTDLYMTPRPPRPAVSPRRRPTSAHASCYQSRTRVAPADDRVFHSHVGPEYRSSAGTGSCSVGKYQYMDSDDLDHGGRSSSGKRITMEFQPDCAKRVSVKEDGFEVNGKGISTFYASAFPKRAQNWGKCYNKKNGISRPRSSRPRTAYHSSCSHGNV